MEHPDLPSAAVRSSAIQRITRGITRRLGRRPTPPLRPFDAITRSGLFDPEFYVALYKDVVGDPLEHFRSVGLAEGRRPSAGFDPAGYAASDPYVGGPANALMHYIYHGRAEDRDPHASMLAGTELAAAARMVAESGLFDAEYYRTAHPVVSAEQLDPVLHYLLWGAGGGCDIAAWYPMHSYLAGNPDVRNAAVNPLLHWMHLGRQEKCLGLGQPGKEAVWRTPGHDHPLPDDRIGLEILRARAFLAAYRFDSGSGYTELAIARLAALAPALHFTRGTPDVSILLLDHGSLPAVLGCLDALAHHNSRFSAEVVVLTEEAALGVIPWIRLLSLPGLGPAARCNAAAAEAQGEMLVVLDDSTRVAAGWLDELAGSFALMPQAGLIAAKLFARDGTLRAAGGTLLRDGAGVPIGAGEDPNRPEYCFARRTGYAPITCFAVRRTVWQAVGGLDPALAWDTGTAADLAMRVGRVTHETWFQPLARVLCFGPPDEPSVSPYYASSPELPAVGPAMLVLDGETHTPDRDAGSVMASRLMEAFRDLGYRQVFFPLYDTTWQYGYSETLQRIGVECHYAPYVNHIGELLARRSGFELALIFRYTTGVASYAALRQHLPTVRILFSNVDLHFLREEREASLIGSRAIASEALITKAQELELFAKVDASLVHTREERDRILAELPAPLDNIVELPWITTVERSAVPWEARHDVIFVGGFRHQPNVDAVRHFASSIWPALLDRLPDRSRFLVVGASPPDDILALAGERIVVTGYVPDLRPFLEQARVMVAPLRYGAGIKGKVITALSHGLPCVASSIALEGMALRPGIDVIRADSPAEVVEGVGQVYDDAALWSQMQENGYSFVVDTLSPERALALCRDAVASADRTWTRRMEQRIRHQLRMTMMGTGDLGLKPR